MREKEQTFLYFALVMFRKRRGKVSGFIIYGATSLALWLRMLCLLLSLMLR